MFLNIDVKMIQHQSIQRTSESDCFINLQRLGVELTYELDERFPVSVEDVGEHTSVRSKISWNAAKCLDGIFKVCVDVTVAASTLVCVFEVPGVNASVSLRCRFYMLDKLVH